MAVRPSLSRPQVVYERYWLVSVSMSFFLEILVSGAAELEGNGPKDERAAIIVGQF